MTKLNATDPPALTDPVLERILVLGARLAAPAMCRPGRTIDDAAQLINPYLNALPRSCAPQVSYSVIMQCPWIDANVASLTGNLWLLDLLAHKLAKAPFNRPMQYDDTLLLDQVSGLGSVDVLDWWHKSDYVIGHDNPLKAASNPCHVAVLQWWLDSGRLGADFPDRLGGKFDLLEPTRKGDMQVLGWWFDNVLREEMDLNDMVGGAGQMDSSRYLLHSFAEAIWVALQAGRMGLVEWWIEISMQYSGMSDKVMSALFASGNRELVAKYAKEYVEFGGDLAESFPFVAFSGDVEYIEHCQQRFPLSRSELEKIHADMILYASYAGHVHVLDFLKQTTGPMHLFSPLVSATVDRDYGAPFWFILSKPILDETAELDISAPALTTLDVAAHLGHVQVLEWWYTHERSAFMAAVQDKMAFLRLCIVALAKNRIEVLNWLFHTTKSKTVPQYIMSAADVAASRGHLQAVQWYFKKMAGAPSDMALDSIISRAFLARQYNVISWILTASGGRFRNKVIEVALDHVQDELPLAHVVEWIWRNAKQIPKRFGQEIIFRLFELPLEIDVDDDSDEDKLTASDMWALLSMIGAQPLNAAGKPILFTTGVLRSKSVDSDYESDASDGNVANNDKAHLINLLRTWRGHPLFLQRLTAAGKAKRIPSLSVPMDLDAACKAAAGVAVLDWMYASICKTSAVDTDLHRGYRALQAKKQVAALEWWNKMGLPANSSVGASDSDSEPDDGELDDEHVAGFLPSSEQAGHSANMKAQYEAMLAEDPVWAAEWLGMLSKLDGDGYGYGNSGHGGYYDGYGDSDSDYY